MLCNDAATQKGNCLITLNAERGLVRVEEWSTLTGRIGFKASLDPGQHELDSIIGRYAEAEKVKCGLSNCRTLHNRGYIVVTKTGFETNIGHACGKKYFGVDFETMSRQLDQIIEEKERREALWSFSFRIDDLAQKVKDLRREDHGADWVVKKSQPLVTMGKACPAAIVRYVSNMLKGGTDAVQVSREATKQETEREEERLGHPVQGKYYVNESVGTISGLQALAEENDLRKMLVLNVEEGLADFRKVKVDELTFEQLKFWSKWANSVDDTLERAERAIGIGRNLLVRENLSCLRKILKTPEEKSEFAAYLNTLN
jgi:hypothetical protein